MNWDYFLRQWGRIFHCNIYLVERHDSIRQVYGEQSLENEKAPFPEEPAFRRLLTGGQTEARPVLYGEEESVLYAVLPFYEKRLVMGPAALGEKNEFAAGVLALWHSMIGQELMTEELWQQKEPAGAEIREARANVQEVIFQRQETELPHNPYEQERREMDSIRRGDREMLRRSLQETYRGEVGQLSRDALRQAKNIAICVVTLASRAAIEGGVLPEEAFSMVDGYILEIEEMTDPHKIEAAMRQAEFELAERVEAVHATKERNELIERTKNHIFQNLHSEIVIGEIGHQIGVSAAWLSALFHRVEGVTIQQYIRHEKIRLAQNLLRYSDYDVKSIANYLAFCSQSHFGKAFKEQTGMTPTSYRAKYGNTQKNENMQKNKNIQRNKKMQRNKNT